MAAEEQPCTFSCGTQPLTANLANQGKRHEKAPPTRVPKTTPPQRRMEGVPQRKMEAPTPTENRTKESQRFIIKSQLKRVSGRKPTKSASPLRPFGGHRKVKATFRNLKRLMMIQDRFPLKVRK